ncbi:hypothetical protein FISHEDRAFT_73519 [Fistulina hepatica ATCC 64428]|uniref:Uncharacterized protein n=1 Tax=Fistulina hepatica ATCC 64428 TaxID=1128425 RepID=A0A0D7AF81_9AGAR|nr:hypothetical protein FISHEDRAFT_73519 [Fistulina hepatica ATCC 64428]
MQTSNSRSPLQTSRSDINIPDAFHETLEGLPVQVTRASELKQLRNSPSYGLTNIMQKLAHDVYMYNNAHYDTGKENFSCSASARSLCSLKESLSHMSFALPVDPVRVPLPSTPLPTTELTSPGESDTSSSSGNTYENPSSSVSALAPPVSVSHFSAPLEETANSKDKKTAYRGLAMLRSCSLYAGLPNGWQFQFSTYAEAYDYWMSQENRDVWQASHRSRLPSTVGMLGPSPPLFEFEEPPMDFDDPPFIPALSPTPSPELENVEFDPTGDLATGMDEENIATSFDFLGTVIFDSDPEIPASTSTQ